MRSDSHFAFMAGVAIIGFNLTLPANAASKVQTITIGATKIDVPIPTGFCVSESAQDKAGDELMALGDPDNITHMILSECGKSKSYQGKAEYFMLKTPRQIVLAEIDRKTALQEFAAVIASNAVDTKQAMNNANRDINKVMPVDMNIVGDIQLRGQDDICTYITGAADVTAEKVGAAYRVALAGCLTTVDKKLISVNWYSYEVTPASIEKMKAKAKALIIAMSGNRPQ